MGISRTLGRTEKQKNIQVVGCARYWKQVSRTEPLGALLTKQELLLLVLGIGTEIENDVGTRVQRE